MPFRSHYIPPLGFFFSSLLFAKSNCEDTFILKFFFKTLCLEIVSFHSRRPLQRQPHEGGNAHKGGGASGASDPGAWPRAKELCPLPPSSLTLPSGQCLSGVCEGVLPGRQRGPRTRFVRVAAGRCHHGNRPRGPRPGLENAESTTGFSPGPSQAAYCRLHFVALPEHLA